MKITNLNGKNVCFIGYAREGRAMQQALKEHAPNAKLTFADSNQSLKIEGAEAQLGPGYLKNLDRFDVVIRSMGVPDKPEFATLGDKVTNSTVIFFDSVADSGVRIVGVTGTKGKSTTSNLIYHALKAADPNTELMGNIGLPMISFLDKAKPGVTFVIELSSYMLEYLRRSPQIAVVTSFFVEHLDRHGSVANYWGAKKNIALHQQPGNAIFYCADYPECKEIADASPATTKVAFTANDFPLPVSATKLKGDHNRSNLAAALKVAEYCGVDRDIAIEALKNTAGLPYRLYSLGTHHGIEWVEDSLATAPEATLFALDALGDDIDTLITGGMDRGGYDFTALGARIAASPIRNIVLFPDTGAAIKGAIEAAKPASPKNYLETNDMTDAVAFAKKHTKKGATCLLSSASPSYNLFKDYEDKAAQFARAIGV
ncbi:MAG TPA: UDP-N-acetylmuramoyl-L-alanine--D-glutamate ligase [Magnetospirillaceae bacterium]|nr:UDP-N-acetylmuramoyl-L-alanine--D-glutamate ligase [Magnetospirillaceae bacterium]